MEERVPVIAAVKEQSVRSMATGTRIRAVSEAAMPANPQDGETTNRKGQAVAMAEHIARKEDQETSKTVMERETTRMVEEEEAKRPKKTRKEAK